MLTIRCYNTTYTLDLCRAKSGNVIAVEHWDKKLEIFVPRTDINMSVCWWTEHEPSVFSNNITVLGVLAVLPCRAGERTDQTGHVPPSIVLQHHAAQSHSLKLYPQVRMDIFHNNLQKYKWMLYLFARKFGLHSEFVWTLLEASWSAR